MGVATPGAGASGGFVSVFGFLKSSAGKAAGASTPFCKFSISLSQLTFFINLPSASETSCSFSGSGSGNFVEAVGLDPGGGGGGTTGLTMAPGAV